MVHRPAEKLGHQPGVLIMHGLVGSKDQPHRMPVALADALAASGFISLRFDLRGRGDSEGLSIDATPQRDLEDARNGLKALAGLADVDANDLVVLGMSWGGVLAACVSAESTAVKRVVLWSSCPVDGDSWKPALFDYGERKVSEQYGNLLGKEFYDGIPELMPVSQLRHNRPATLIVHGTNDEVIRQVPYERLKTDLEFGDLKVKRVTIEGADHAMMRHDWEEKAIKETVQWLVKGD
jgi:dienelactone hydrolase